MNKVNILVVLELEGGEKKNSLDVPNLTRKHLFSPIRHTNEYHFKNKTWTMIVNITLNKHVRENEDIDAI